MTATNHALTGAVIGLAVQNPFIALVLAILSHFVLDALPHYEAAHADIGSNAFRNQLVVDAALCVLLVITLRIALPKDWLISSLCAFAATSPDFMWMPKYLRARQGNKATHSSKMNPVMWVHSKVQWFHKPIGAIPEILWASGACLLLVKLV